MNKTNTAKLKVITAMFIYGTIGIFVRYLPFASSVTAMLRGLIGAPVLLLVLRLKKQKISWQAIKSNLLRLILLGVMLGMNWILLFEACRYTTVATATLCYYFAPIFIVAVSPFVFKEKMTAKKAVCILTALVGMVFVSGVAQNGMPKLTELKGVLFGLGAAVLYAAVVVNNKKLKGISPYDRTVAQLAISCIVLLPYNLFTDSFRGFALTPTVLVILLIVGIVHTGLSYFLYFGSMESLNSQTLAILSYIDPVVAVILSALLLKEQLGLFGIIGAVLVIGSAVAIEVKFKKLNKSD